MSGFQIVNLRLRARSLERYIAVPEPRALRLSARPAQPKNRPVFFGPELGWVTTPLAKRADLTGQPTSGPLIIEEYDTTIVVPPDAAVTLESGIVRIRLKTAGPV